MAISLVWSKDAVIGDSGAGKGHEDEGKSYGFARLMEVLEPSASCHSVMPGSKAMRRLSASGHEL